MRIDLLMALRIMLLNMLKLRRLPKRRDIPIQIPHPIVDLWVPAPDIPDVTLEMLHVYGIEADDSRVEPDVRFRDLGAEVEGFGVLGEVRFDAIKSAEEGCDSFFVGFLRPGESE